MQVSFADFDRLQNNLRQAQDDILRLYARVTALEGGEALPPDQSITPIIEAPAPSGVAQTDYVEPTEAEIVASVLPEPDTNIPDISIGWVGGGRRS